MNLEPANPQAYFDLGLAQARHGDDASAGKSYRQAIRLEPAYADAHENLGGVLLRQGSGAESVGEYRQALELNPARAAFHYNLANALLTVHGSREEATAELRTALNLDSNLEPAKALLRGLGQLP